MKKFYKGDLVKNKTKITWRDQNAAGIIVEACGNYAGSEVVRIKWITPPVYAAKGIVTHYSSSLELMASAK